MDQPIACTLAPARYRDRVTDLATLADRGLLDRTPIPGGARLTFAAGVRAELEAAVAAEAECCAFLTFDLRERGEQLVLDVTGPDEARPVLEELFSPS